MKPQTMFRVLIVLAWFLQLLIYTVPVHTWYEDDALVSKLMSYDGYNSLVSLRLRGLAEFPIVAFLIATVGMYFFQNWARYLYLALWVYGWSTTLLFGLRVGLPLQGFLGMALGTVDGAILALAFLSPLGAAFVARNGQRPAPRRDGGREDVKRRWEA